MPLSGGSSRRVKALSPIPTPRVEDVTSSHSSQEQPVVFKLQLRPLEDSESFKPSVQLVSREFATRYLESVGVRPSKATMDLVNRNVPLTETHIKTTLRAKGHVEDEIHISVPPVTHRYRVPMVINPAAVLQLGIGNSVLGSGPDGQADPEGGRPGSSGSCEDALSEEGFSGRAGDAATASTAAGRPPGGTDFLDMAARYLHPFNLDLTLARRNLTALHVAARAKLAQGAAGDANDNPLLTTASGAASAAAGGGGGGLGGGVGGSSFGTSTSGRVGAPGLLDARGATSSVHSSFGFSTNRRSGSWPRSSSGRLLGLQDDGGGSGGGGGGAYDATRLEVLEELAQPLLVTPEVVLTLQAQLEAALADWHRHQAPEALKGRLTAEEFHRTQEELSSEGMVKLLITVVNFLHEELIRGHPSYQAPQTARESSRPSGGGLMTDRSSQARGASGDGGGSGGHTARRSHAGSAMPRGGSGVQLPASISIQQMTNLQKYDLGYQAYVRQKLEQRQSQGSFMGGRGEHGTRTQLTTPASEVRPISRPTGFSAGGDRPAASAMTSQASLQQPRSQSAHQQQQQNQSHHYQTGRGAQETQRVSFAVAPLYNSALPGSPQADNRPGSPGPRGGASSASLLGPLNLPGSRSRPTSSQPNTPGTANGSRSRAGSPNSPNSAGGDLFDRDSLASPPIPGLPPHVGRALRHSPSFALASAANTARSIHASLDADDMAALQRERLFALHVDFAGRFKSLRQKRSGMFFTLPILLLATRLVVNLLFSTLYPLWTRLPDGERVLEQMDAALCGLFDPHGYLERALSLLQSTPSAIEAVTRHPQRRGNERRHFSDTSPLIQASLQGAKSAGARKLMKAAANQPKGLGLMRTQLSTEQRAALFQMGLIWMQQPDPVLSQVGEPHAVGRL